MFSRHACSWTFEDVLADLESFATSKPWDSLTDSFVGTEINPVNETEFKQAEVFPATHLESLKPRKIAGMLLVFKVQKTKQTNAFESKIEADEKIAAHQNVRQECDQEPKVRPDHGVLKPEESSAISEQEFVKRNQSITKKEVSVDVFPVTRSKKTKQTKVVQHKIVATAAENIAKSVSELVDRKGFKEICVKVISTEEDLSTETIHVGPVAGRYRKQRKPKAPKSTNL